jgi:hypothetical protein
MAAAGATDILRIEDVSQGVLGDAGPDTGQLPIRVIDEMNVRSIRWFAKQGDVHRSGIRCIDRFE